MANLSEIQIAPAKLREARAGMKQTEAAKAVGIVPQRLYAYETGQDRLPAHILARLAILYRRPIEYFIQPQSENNPQLS